MSSYKMPTEVVELPSKGLVYSATSLLSSGSIEMKYMTAKEEDILTNSNYLKQGIWLDKLLQSMIVSKIDYNELILGDKDAIILASRILGYGKDYTFTFYSTHSNQNETVTIDLTLLKEKPIVETYYTPGKNEFTYTLPYTENKITFKLLTVGDELAIEKELAGLRKLDAKASYDVTVRLKQMILSVNGDTSKASIRDFVDNGLLAKDARAFREHVATILPGVDLKYVFTHDDGVEEDIEIPINLNFFWPES